jgi:hypothetical protein
MTKKKVSTLIKEGLERVETERAVPTPTTPVTATELKLSPCLYVILLNDRWTVNADKSTSMEGAWYGIFVDTSEPDTSRGPIVLRNSRAEALTGYVDFEYLKTIVRGMASHLLDYESTPVVIGTQGCKFMSTLVYKAVQK